MARYLIVTHQTAFSVELQERVRALIREDPEAEFGILVPEIPADVAWEGGAFDSAPHRASATKALLAERTGAQVFRAVGGVSDPLEAIAQELEAQPGYEGLVICTLPVGISRWLRLDIVRRATRRFDLPVIHVVAGAQVRA